MDKFEETMKKMSMMSPEDQKKMKETIRSKCTCPQCPTYDSCMKEKGELLYCSTGKSACAVTETGCICPTCPVTEMMGLSHAFYCSRGSEKQLRGL
ncbi:MAG TPA: DUF2769 domain-containing protein [Methanoregulaceae archaeon]|nr:DUF2769 domain-containing protein [Methanoregulaceae archaeon]